MKYLKPLYSFALFFITLLSCPGLAEESVDFTRDIAPMLSKNCVACHNANRKEGGLNLESYEALMQGGDGGDSIVAGDLELSYLLVRVSGSEEEPIMPPEDNQVGAKVFTPNELKLLESWIMSGAKPGSMVAATKLEFQKLPDSLRPVYALAASLDGQHLAFGRGNEVMIHGSNAGTSATTISSSESAAHLDIVQSIAISPQSDRMATGGYRNVKVWKRVHKTESLLTGLNATKLNRQSISSNGKQLAYFDVAGKLEILDLESGQSTRFLKSHASPVTALTWIPSGQLLSVDASGAWSLTTKQETGFASKTLTLPNPRKAVSIQVADSALVGVDDAGKLFTARLAENQVQELKEIEGFDGVSALQIVGSNPAQVAIGLKNGNIPIGGFDGQKIQVTKTLVIGAPIQSIDFSASANRVLVSSEGKPVQIWDTQTAKMVASLNSDYARNQQIRFASRNAKRQKSKVDGYSKKLPELQKASDKEKEALKKVQENRDKAETELEAKTKDVDAAKAKVTEAEKAVAAAQAALAAAQKQIESANKDLEAKKKAIEDANGKRDGAQSELDERDQALAAAKDSANRVAALVPEMEKKIASEKQIQSQLEQALKEIESKPLQNEVSSFVLAAGTNTAVLACKDKQLRAYSLQDGAPLPNLYSGASLKGLLITPGDHKLLALSEDGELLRVPLGSKWNLEHSVGDPNESPFSDRITALDFSPDGKLLAVGSGPPSRFGEIQLLSVDSGKVERSLGEVHSDTVFSLKFSPDGRQLASAGADKLCKTLDVATGKPLRSFEGHTHHILGLAWQDDGQVLVTASADASLKVWRTETGEQIRTISGFRKEVTAVQFVGLTHHFVMSDAAGSIRLYNADDGKQMKTFAGAKDAVFGIAVSGDETRISAGGQLGQIWTWQLSDAKLLSTLPQAP